MPFIPDEQQTGFIPDTPSESEFPQRRSFLQKTGQFLGMQPLGESIARGIYDVGRRFSPQSPSYNLPTEEAFGGQAPTAGQVAGSALQTAALAAPVSGALQAAKLSGIGAASSFGSSLENQAGIGRTLFNTALGAAIGPLFPLGGKVARLATERLPERLMTNIFKTSSDEQLRIAYAIANGKEAPPTLARKALENNLKGSPQAMIVHTITSLKDFEGQLQNKIKGKLVSLPNKKGFLEALTTINGALEAHSFGTSPEALQEGQRLAQALKGKGDVVDAQTALDLKRYIDDMRNTSSFHLDAALSPKQTGLKSLANTARSELKKQVPGTSETLSKESDFINLRDEIVKDAVRRGNKQVLSFADALFLGGGSAFSPFAGLTAETAFRAFQEPGVITRVAGGLFEGGQVARRFGKSIPPRFSEPTKQILRRSIATQIPRLFSGQ